MTLAITAFVASSATELLIEMAYAITAPGMRFGSAVPFCGSGMKAEDWLRLSDAELTEYVACTGCLTPREASCVLAASAKTTSPVFAPSTTSTNSHA